MHERCIIKNVETTRLDDKYKYGIGGLNASGLGDSTGKTGPMAKLMGERIHLATVCEGDKGICTDLPLVYMN